MKRIYVSLLLGIIISSVNANASGSPTERKFNITPVDVIAQKQNHPEPEPTIQNACRNVTTFYTICNGVQVMCGETSIGYYCDSGVIFASNGFNFCSDPNICGFPSYG